MPRIMIKDPRWAAINRDGTPCSGARLHVYQAGSDILAAIYYDESQNVVAPNPLVADERGMFPLFYADDSIRYKVKILDPNGQTISLCDGI